MSDWFSDLLFIVSVYVFQRGMTCRMAVVHHNRRRTWRHYPAHKWFALFATSASSLQSSHSVLLSFWQKGFLLMQLTPLPYSSGCLSWHLLSYRTTTVYSNPSLFSGLLGTIVCTDIMKIVLSKKIRVGLAPKTMQRLHQFSGGALILFGIVLFIRSLSLS